MPDTTGSSPLARGTRQTVRIHQYRATVHPRSRGEHGARSRRRWRNAGSSPLARGTHRGQGARKHPGRFIPARAGNTRWWGRGAAGSAVHPRSRGEHNPSGAGNEAAIGSSPLARGTPPDLTLPASPPRFIPARAGNTGRARRTSLGGSVHPRSRGEHIAGVPLAWAHDGSSPLARGTHRPSDGDARRARFIPARAGNTRSSPGCSPSPPVHPRSRGEHSPGGGRSIEFTGSSPLARGTRQGFGEFSNVTRFIPARAGNTKETRKQDDHLPVHPRSRGEHSRRCSASVKPVGSSPLARGTPRGRSGSRSC